MVNRNYLVLVSLIVFLVSCTGNRENSQNVPSITITEDSVLISNPSDKQYKIAVSILNENVLSEDIGKKKSLSLLELARKCSDKREVALSAVQSANKIPVNIKIAESLDT